MRKTPLLLAALFLFAAGCGTGSASGDSASQPDDDGRPQSFEDLEFNSPLGDYLGFDFGDSDNMEAEMEEMNREAGRITAQCMLDKGFEYTPMDTSGFVSFGSNDGEPAPFSTAWIDKYGFGITTQRFPQSSVGDLVGYPDENLPGGEEFVDPNQAYVEGLSEGERQAYQEALYGLPQEAPQFDEDSDESFSFQGPSGCQGEGFDAAFNDGPGAGPAFFQEFGNELQAMEERAQADPRVIEYNNEVGDCVAEAGETWTNQQDLYQRFEDRLSEIQPAMFGPGGGDPFEAAGVDPDEMSEREMEEFFRDLERIDPSKLPILAELQAEEIALAKIVVGCDGGPLNEAFFLGEIRAEYEQEFIDTNADALAEFKAE